MCGFFKLFIALCAAAVLGYAGWSTYRAWQMPLPDPMSVPQSQIEVPVEPELAPTKGKGVKGLPVKGKPIKKPGRGVGNGKLAKPDASKKKPGKGLSSVYSCDDVRKYAEYFGREQLLEIARKRGYSRRQIAAAQACFE